MNVPVRLWGARLGIISAALTFGCSAPKSPSASSNESTRAIEVTLDDFHQAATDADEARYFGHFSPGGVFLGTDATERWDVSAFRAYAHPHFEKKKVWSFRAVSRHVMVDPSGHVAWFDEALATKNLGPARGSGVLVRTPSGKWEIAHYVLSITVPNARFQDVKAILEASAITP